MVIIWRQRISQQYPIVELLKNFRSSRGTHSIFYGRVLDSESMRGTVSSKSEGQFFGIGEKQRDSPQAGTAPSRSDQLENFPNFLSWKKCKDTNKSCGRASLEEEIRLDEALS